MAVKKTEIFNNFWVRGSMLLKWYKNKKITEWKVWEYVEERRIPKKECSFYKPRAWLEPKYNGRWQQVPEQFIYGAEIPAPKPVFWASFFNFIDPVFLFIENFFIEIYHILGDFIKMLKQKKHKREVPIKALASRISQKMKSEKNMQWIIAKANRKKERLWLPAITYAGIILAVYFHLRPGDVVMAFWKTAIGREALKITGNQLPVIRSSEFEFVMFSGFIVIFVFLTAIFCLIDYSQNLKEKESECVKDAETGITINEKFIGNLIDKKYVTKEELN